MMRPVIAYLLVDEDMAFEESDGVISYLEREFGWLEQSNIILQDAAIADTDATDPRGAYLVYLARFAFDYFQSKGAEQEDSEPFGEPSASPMTYAEWIISTMKRRI